MGEVRIKRDVSDAIVYGIHIDPNTQDPSNAVTYLENAVGMTPASMGSTTFNSGSWADAFFIPKPCMVRYDGTVDYYLDPSDYSKKADGTTSDIADPNYGGNAMMEWDLIWFKFEPGEAAGEGYFYVSNKKVNDSFNCWCNYDANNNITQHFYTAIYNGTGIDKLRSISGVQLTPENGSGNTTGQQEISRAMANNTSDLTEWYIDLWADEILATGLLYLMGKSLNLQATYGRGLDSGGQTAKESYVTGALNDKGLFWGDTTNGNNAVKVFGMENFWGGCAHRTAGLFGTVDGYAYKLTHGNIDGSIATEFGTNANGYIPVTVARPKDGYVNKMLFGKHGMLPSTSSGSLSTYYCDYFYNGTGFSRVGGSSNGSFGCGFSINLSSNVSSASWAISTSLSLKPRAKTPYNPDWDNRPAHQFINGEWIDIPTHKFINGRWQGELTSQSPLKFRADGEMLDWRVEGRTSENLVDENTIEKNKYIYNGTINNSTASNLSDYIPIKNNSTYILSWIADTLSSTNPRQIGIFNSQKEYLDYIQFAPYKNFTIQSNALIELNIAGAAYIRITVDTQMTNIMLNLGSTDLPYEPYGGVGDYDETEQKYRIPVKIEGENLVESVTVSSNQALYGVPLFLEAELKPDTEYTFAFQLTEGYYVYWNEYLFTNNTPFITGAGDTTIVVTKKTRSDISKNDIKQYSDSKGGWVIHKNRKEEDSPASYTNVRLYEGTYTASTLPPYEVNIFTDHQLMDGDSIDFTTDQTAIPIATGNNTLSVDTAVKPSKVFVKFEG